MEKGNSMERGEDAAQASDRPVPSHFDAFDLSIEMAGDRYLARVTASPVGARQPMEIDLSGVEPLAMRIGAGSDRDAAQEADAESEEVERDLRRPPADRDALRARGEKLFNAVFTGTVGECFRQSIERQRRSEGAGLLIHLHFDSAPELATLPWEALWDPKQRAFLADLPDLPVSRGLTVPSEENPPGPAMPPLHLMALLPEPSGDPKLTGEAEWEAICERLGSLIASGQLVAERVDPPSLGELGRRLKKVSCDVLHIVAHGGPGDSGAGGCLRLEDGSGGVDLVTGTDLARAFERRRPPRLIVLSACHGGRASTDDAFDGLAQHLLSRGVSAVVAMRSAISDSAAAAFASFLYEELAAERTVEAAMVEARRYLALGRHRAEWATPVLYLRRANVPVFDTGDIPIGILDDPAERPLVTKNQLGMLAVALLAALALAWIGMGSLFAPSDGPQLPPTHADCPSPPGLDDLRFARINAGVLELPDRKAPLTVEKAFCIGLTEVTWGQWAEVMNIELDEDQPENEPATNMTIREAREFNEKLEARDEGGGYRLPTYDEWELAARGGQATRYSFGDDESELHLHGNCRNGIESDGFETTAPVATFEPNPNGLYDVHGNVGEWVEWPDPESEHPLSEGVILGEDGYWVTLDETKGHEEALRIGGSFENSVANCAFGKRWHGVKLEDDNREETGFRVVRSIVPETD